MKERKRWGKKFKDKRDWRKYNEELVVRGEFYLDCKWVRNWNKELNAMNEGKVGALYEYPDSFMHFMAVLGQWIDYRGLEGVARKLVEFGQLPRASTEPVCTGRNRRNT